MINTRAGGLLYLGQDQDSLGGGFNLRQSWGGEITQFNVWSWALEEYYIENMAECRSDLFGDVLKWDEHRYFLGKVGCINCKRQAKAEWGRNLVVECHKERLLIHPS